jgi:TRAP-type C4-dicarboxylate transport system permease small subunit
MSHGTDLGALPPASEVAAPALSGAMRLIAALNRGVVCISMLALLLTALILSYSVVSRYLLRAATDWQDEASVFLLVGATFLCSAYVQSVRGHVGIEAISTLLPARLNRIRQLCVDAFSCMFCSFFAWKSWTLLQEAWIEGHTTSSSWAPPLWIPYLFMALGMSLLAVQILLQFAAAFFPMEDKP